MLKVKKRSLVSLTQLKQLELTERSSLRHSDIVVVEYDEEVPTISHEEAILVVAHGGSVRAAWDLYEGNKTAPASTSKTPGRALPVENRYRMPPPPDQGDVVWSFSPSWRYVVEREPLPAPHAEPPRVSSVPYGTLGWAVNEVNYGRGVVHKQLGPVVAIAEFINGLPDDSEVGWESAKPMEPELERQLRQRRAAEQLRWRHYRDLMEGTSAEYAMRTFEQWREADRANAWNAYVMNGGQQSHDEFVAEQSALDKQMDGLP